MATQDPTSNPAAEAALKKYRQGMKELGQGLIALAVFQGAVGILLLATGFASPLYGAIAGVMAALHLVLGWLLLRHRSGVNWFVAVWSALLFATSCLGMGIQSGQGRQGANPGGCIGLLIAGVMFYSSVRNLINLRKAQAAGLEP
jgi:hypothetical protein